MGPIKRLRDISDEYLVGRELGKGTYGTVHICSRQSKPRDANLVIKKIDLKNNKRKGIADLVKEAKLLKLFDHPNVSKMNTAVYETHADGINIHVL
jgi:serine/threonine protein kinase